MNYMVRHKIWMGFWNQKPWNDNEERKPDDLGEEIWDYSTLYFDNYKEAIKYVRTLGCDCCSKPPKIIQREQWYDYGYANKVMIRKAKRV